MGERGGLKRKKTERARRREREIERKRERQGGKRQRVAMVSVVIEGVCVCLCVLDSIIAQSTVNGHSRGIASVQWPTACTVLTSHMCLCSDSFRSNCLGSDEAGKSHSHNSHLRK